MKFSVIIPARYASSRLPGKPLADIGGKPMIVRVAERARRSGAAEVLVATDHPGIAEAAARHGYEAVMTSARHASGTDRLAEVAVRRRYRPDHIVVNLQGDEPLIDPALVKRVAQALARNRSADIATAAHPLRDARAFLDPAQVKVVLDDRGYALYFSRAPIPHARDAFARGIRRIPPSLPVYGHVGIYAYRAGFLRRFTRLAPSGLERFEALEQLRALSHGCRIVVALARHAPARGVDTPADLRRVRKLF